MFHDHRRTRPIVIASVILSVIAHIPLVQAIVPTGSIDVSYDSTYCENNHRNENGKCYFTLLASQASFGIWPSMDAQNNDEMIPILPPDDDPLLCLGTSTTIIDTANNSKYIMIAPRGQCTFEQKTIVAQAMGAAGIVIYGTLASRYSLNATSTSEKDANNEPYLRSDIVYPSEFHDYDCHNAMAHIDMPKLTFNLPLPYDSVNNDPILSGTASQGNLCAAQNVNFENTCPSQKCLLTGKIIVDDVNGNDEQNPRQMEACCAWDNHIWLYKGDTNSTAPSSASASTSETAPDIGISAFYITMAEADALFSFMQGNKVSLTLYRRYYPSYNLSSILIWALGVFVAAIAAYLSASEYRDARYAISANDASSSSESTRKDSDVDTLLSASDDGQTSALNHNDGSGSGSDRPGYERASTGSSNSRMPPDESLELDASHAVGFIIFSSAGLLVLFFFQIYNVVKVFYAFGCSGAIFQVVFYPLYYKVMHKLGFRDRVAFVTDFLELGVVTVLQMAAAITSYGLGAVWLYIAFTHNHPDTSVFFWVMQDIMGASMCIMFLATMKLNSIKVASILLTAAFFYDIFFVFVTPYLTKGGKSIMVDVATSGGPPTADPSWCEKYPDDKDCQGGDPLPMLLTIPRIGDYAGGSSLLGLGDIVLPGLLLSFAARYDEAKKFIGCANRGSSRPDNRQKHCSAQSRQQYLLPLVIAYAIGLAMANIAVYVMAMGQPALLYLVPCCLGTMAFLGWKRGELSELWNTPRVLASCDEIIYGPMDRSDDEIEDESTAANTGEHTII